MSHDLPMQVWVVWFRDHIHTNVCQQLAVFPKRKDADAWMKSYGGPDCSIRALKLSKLSNARARSIKAGERSARQ